MNDLVRLRSRALPAVLASLALVGACTAALILIQRPQATSASGHLLVYCAAGLQKPVEQLAKQYQQAFAIEIQLQFGGTGTLLGNLEVVKTGDLFIAADEGTVAIARAKHLVAEAIPLARQRPVIAVAAGNPKGVAGLADLLKDGVRLGLANPDAAAVSKLARSVLTPSGKWAPLQAAAKVLKPTVKDLANDLKIGAIDAAIVWDTTVFEFSGALTAVEAVEFNGVAEQAMVTVLTSSTQPAAALAFARYLASPEHGNPVFTANGYVASAGDRWATRPELVFFSGAVNRPAIEASLREFATREGAGITTTFNGCGILCAQMKDLAKTPGSAVPDAYFACDVCFVPPVADLYPEAALVSETDIVIAVPRDNPKRIATLADLAKPGLKLGVSNAEQATLGFMTKRMLKQAGLYEAVRANIVSEVPTGDLLVNQLATGSLDAVIVYAVNIGSRTDKFAAVPIPGDLAKAVQPFAVAKSSANRQLAGRLLDHLIANKDRFVAVGFRWRFDPTAPLQASAALSPASFQSAGGAQPSVQ